MHMYVYNFMIQALTHIHVYVYMHIHTQTFSQLVKYGPEHAHRKNRGGKTQNEKIIELKKRGPLNPHTNIPFSVSKDEMILWCIAMSVPRMTSVRMRRNRRYSAVSSDCKNAALGWLSIKKNADRQ